MKENDAGLSSLKKSAVNLHSIVQKVAQFEKIAVSSNTFFLLPLNVDISSPAEEKIDSSVKMYDPWETLTGLGAGKTPVKIEYLTMVLLNDPRLWFLGLAGTNSSFFEPRLHGKRNLQWIGGGQMSVSLVTRGDVQLLKKVLDEKIEALTRLMKTTKSVSKKQLEEMRRALPSLWKRLFWKYKEVDDWNKAWQSRRTREEVKRNARDLRMLRKDLKNLAGAKSVVFVHWAT